MTCPPPESWKQVAQQSLGREETQALEAHAAGCENCASLLFQRRAQTAKESETTGKIGAPAPLAADEPTFRVMERGARLGRYVVLEQLGVGGMGVVYSAFDAELERRVAIKLLQQAESTDAQAHSWLMREAQAMARLAHPNVVAVHDVGEHEGQIFIAMELVEGMTLRSWNEHKHRWQEVLALLQQAGAGLSAAHAAGLTHRDFKPDNVLVGRDGRVRVMDFGLARSSGPGTHGPAAELPLNFPDSDGTPSSGRTPSSRLSVPLTQVGQVMGTPAYMAPEQFEGTPADARSDQFSFAVALYESLYGERPYGKHPERRPPSQRWRLREVPKGSNVPAWLRKTLLKSLSVDPEERYSSMQELMEALSKNPAVSRRKWMTAAAGGVFLLVVGSGVRFTMERQSQLCRGAEQKLVGIWDGANEALIEQSFLATGHVQAMESFRKIHEVMGHYAQSWVGMRQDTCEATRIRGEQSDEILSLRMQCLDRRLDELRALTQLFTRADAQIVSKSVSAAYGLVDVESCADIVALQAPVALPDSPQVRQEVTEVRGHLAEAKALLDSGKSSVGLPVVTKMMPQIRALKYRPLEAEALYLQALLEGSSVVSKSATDTLLSAIWTAYAGHHDTVAAEATIELVRLEGNLHHFPEAERWMSLADAAVERLGRPERLEASRLMGMGLVYVYMGRFQQALDTTQRGVWVAAKALGPEHLEVGRGYNILGVVYDTMGRPREAVEAYGRALATREKLLGPRHPDVGVTAMNLGLAYQSLGNYAEAAALARRAGAIAMLAHGPDSYTFHATQHNLGEALQGLGKLDEAHAMLLNTLRAWERQLGPEESLLAGVLDSLGSVDVARGNWKRALEYHQRALAISRKTLPQGHPDLARSLTGMGRAQLGLKEVRRSLTTLEEALAIQEATETPAKELAETRFALAQTLRAGNGPPQQVTQLAKQAEEGFEKAGNTSRAEAVEHWLTNKPRPAL